MQIHRRDSGFSLAALIFFLTAASIFIAAAVPAYQMQAKRDLEEELIFRGEEYTRAIVKYQRRFGVYPTSVDQLVSTNGLRFVRRAYKDPINGKDFRLIFINPDGTLTGSKLFQQNINTQPMFGANTNTFNSNPNAPNTNNPNNPAGGNRQPNTNTPTSPTGTSAFSNPFAGPAGNAGNTAGRPNTQTPSVTTGNANANANRQTASLGSTTPTGGSNTNQPVSSGGIIGVASDASVDSIKVYNQRQKYDEWEFIAILNQPGQNNPNNANNPNAPNANPNNPGGNNPNNTNNPNNPFQPRQPNTNNPFQSPTNPGGNNPFSTPNNNNNNRQIQNPFGFGNSPQQQQNQPGKR